MITEPALRFWLRYAEREGAVYEDTSDAALVLLPDRLQSAFGLPQEVDVTAEPDVARDDGALLLIPGHPAVDVAAAAVLDEGDVGWSRLAWPSSQPPAASVLEARAREMLAVDHGRIDVVGQPASVYVPVLRLGALVTYGVSLDQRFRERVEVWVDARAGVVVDDEVRTGLEAWPRAPGPDPSRSCLLPDLTPALGRADAILRARADSRLAVLARHAEGARRDQLATAAAYFEAALSSVVERRAAATPERRRLLDAQVDAIRAERERRMAEIDETFRPTSELKPFRAHLLLVPALSMAVEVRRGPRAYPFSLTWVLPAACFSRSRCPHCGADQELVAGRERLGCRGCLAPPVPARLPAPPVPPPAPPSTAATPAAAARPPGRHGRPHEGRAAKPRAGAAAPPEPQLARRSIAEARPPASSKRVSPRADRTSEQYVARVGGKLAFEFWAAVAEDRRWPRKAIDPQSPLAASYRLYGPAGPARALGLPSGAPPRCFSAATAQEAVLPNATTGAVVADGLPWAYTLRWRLQQGRAVVVEVLPFPGVRTNALPPDTRLSPMLADRLFDGAPALRAPLDEVAAAIWRHHLPAVGLPVVLRVLAAWWRAYPEGVGVEAEAPDVVAAALVGLVGGRSGRRGLKPEAATGAEPSAVAAASSRLQKILRLSRERPW